MILVDNFMFDWEYELTKLTGHVRVVGLIISCYNILRLSCIPMLETFIQHY